PFGTTRARTVDRGCTSNAARLSVCRRAWNTEASMDPCYVGIDVAKDTLEVAASTDRARTWRIVNSPEGWAALAQQLADLRPVLIVLEASGGYEVGAATAVALAGWPVAVVNPRQVRD